MLLGAYLCWGHIVDDLTHIPLIYVIVAGGVSDSGAGSAHHEDALSVESGFGGGGPALLAGGGGMAAHRLAGIHSSNVDYTQVCSFVHADIGCKMLE